MKFFYAIFSSLFEEAGTSIGKKQVNEQKQNIFAMGFLNMFFASAIFLLISLAKKSFVFSLASLPTFGARILLEIVQVTVSIEAIADADRSTYSLVKAGTIPLLIIADSGLMYQIGSKSMVGITIILIAIAYAICSRGIDKKGLGLVLLSTIIPVGTISLFKYNITHFNSLEAEQSIIMIILMIYLLIMSEIRYKCNPIKTMFEDKRNFIQAAFAGLGTVFIGLAYKLDTASIINTIQRGAAAAAGVISGKIYFKEKRFLHKVVTVGLIVVGLAIIAIG